MQLKSGTVLITGATGEIGTRGALLMLGYFDNQKATEESFNRGGWFMSGDLGRLDENGCLQIVKGSHKLGRIDHVALRSRHCRPCPGWASPSGP